MSLPTRRYLFFVSKPYSFAILEPLQEYILAETPGDVRWYLASLAKQHAAPGQALTTTRQVHDFNPDAVLAPGNAVPHFWPGLKVQLFHGLDDEVRGFYRLTGFFDLYCTSGPAITGPFDQLAREHGHFLVEETGWPKLDPLAKHQDQTALRKVLGLDPAMPVLLYAPTFPPRYTSAPALMPAIEQLIGGPYQWLIKFHPQMDAAVQHAYRQLSNQYLQVVDNQNILPAMQAADVLISDTSSVAYEFLLMDLPIITFRAIARKDKGLDITQTEQLAGAIRRSLDRPDEFASKRREYLSQLHPYLDGQSSRRVVEAVEHVLRDNLHHHLRRKPLNLVRKWKVRRLAAT